MKKIVYSYDPITGQYAGTAIAFEDALEPGTYLIPANATEAEPPFEPNEGGDWLHWNGSAWEWKSWPIPETPIVPEPTSEELAQAARVKRNILLAESDWTQLLDASLTTEQVAAWRTYRSELRDVTKQVLFPTDIDWPVKPS